MYSLGVILYNMATNSFPTLQINPSKSDKASGKLHMKYKTYSIPWNLDVSIKLLDLINICLRYDSETRASVDEIAESHFLTKKCSKKDAKLTDIF